VRNGENLPDTASLAEQLNDMTHDSAPEQAQLLARTAVDRSYELAVEYRSIRPAWLHNCYVQSGIRERGLCWHWADDLLETLETLDLPAFSIHPVVARFGTKREHNAVAVSPKGGSFADGIVLDPWRKCGHLVWADLREDKYPWHKRIYLTNHVSLLQGE
jgi:hypothetical protein